MKKTLLNNMVVGFLLTILIASCTTSQDVASNSWIQKRKYTKGYHIEKGSKAKHDPIKADETFTAQEVAPIETEIEKVSAAVVTASEVAVAENNTQASKVAAKEKTKITEKGITGKAVKKAKEHTQRSKEAFNNYRMADAAAVGAISPLGVDATSEMHKYLKKAILAAIIATVLWIVAVILIAASATNTVTGSGTGGGIGAGIVVSWIAYVFYIIAVVFFVLWLVDKFAN